MTSYKPRPAGTLKQAVDRLIEAAGGLERAAELAGKSRTVMARYSDPAEPGRQMPVDTVRALEAAADYRHVSAFLAREAGFAVMPVASCQSHVPGLVAEAMREAADVFVEATEALADMEISADEAGGVVQEIDEALTTFHALRQRLVEVRRARDDGPGLREVGK